jgi:hypothetical protein
MLLSKDLERFANLRLGTSGVAQGEQNAGQMAEKGSPVRIMPIELAAIVDIECLAILGLRSAEVTTIFKKMSKIVQASRHARAVRVELLAHIERLPVELLRGRKIPTVLSNASESIQSGSDIRVRGIVGQPLAHTESLLASDLRVSEISFVLQEDGEIAESHGDVGIVVATAVATLGS